MKEWLNSVDQIVSGRSLDSPRAVGDAIENLIKARKMYGRNTIRPAGLKARALYAKETHGAGV